MATEELWRCPHREKVTVEFGGTGPDDKNGGTMDVIVLRCTVCGHDEPYEHPTLAMLMAFHCRCGESASFDMVLSEAEIALISFALGAYSAAAAKRLEGGGSSEPRTRAVLDLCADLINRFTRVRGGQ